LYAKTIRPFVVAEADSIDIEAISMVDIVIAHFWTLLETWAIAEPLDRSQPTTAGRTNDKQDLLLSRAQSLQGVEQINVCHV
jgi:hypothetical protein